MENFQIRQVYSYKGCTFCLSVVKGNAFWSIHKGVFPIEVAVRSFQRQHNEQILSLIGEKLRAESNPNHSPVN
jgi:hypothetical protein